jgi:hypothetical protein
MHCLHHNLDFVKNACFFRQKVVKLNALKELWQPKLQKHFNVFLLCFAEKFIKMCKITTLSDHPFLEKNAD